MSDRFDQIDPGVVSKLKESATLYGELARIQFTGFSDAEKGGWTKRLSPYQPHDEARKR